VKVPDTTPSGSTLAGMSGSNWTCSGNTCQRAANFQPGPIQLRGSITGKSGPLNARASALNIANKGPGMTNGAEITSV